MSTWTDDELGDLLRETLHDHEEPDDADDAVRIARTAASPVRRRPPLGLITVAASLVIVTGLGVLGARAVRDDTGTASSTVSSAVAGAGARPAPHRPARTVVTGAPIGARIRTMASDGALADQAAPPGPATTSIEDAGRLGSLVQLVNGLPGATPLPRACPPTRPQPGYTTLVLRTSDGTWRFTVSDDCASMLSVRRDGREIGALDATGFGRRLRATLAAPAG